MIRAATLFAAAVWLSGANAHLAAFHKGMYCLNGPQIAEDLNSYAIVSPLYQLGFNDWWFHHINGCDQYPPADGDFLELPAGGSFTVEIASNRAKTTLSYNGRDTSEWPDGATYPEDYNVPSCITSPNMHAQNQSMAAGTAFAISYQSDIKQVTPQNLAVFTVRYNTPWKRVLSYDVPANMPACPPGGCICAWGWVPNGCGQPNIYQQAYKCQVTNAKSTTPIAAPKPPVWCEGNPGACVKGSKQMIYWNQNEGNNIAVDGYDLAGDFKSPAYNSKLGFADGAQNDIFSGAPSAPAGNSGSNTGGSSSNSGSGSNNSGSNNAGSNNSGSNSGSGSGSSNSNSGAPNVAGLAAGASTSASVAAPSASAAAATSSNNGAGNPDTGIPNQAPSCKKRASRRRRTLAVSDEATSELVKKSPQDVGITAHRRFHARREW
ncbi:hypothetical protein CVT25_000435 [Psilocybe cyanescens]|uniref:Uncharacterized protein n=1 Tax=Psilocybe cyanescens TaxID=93625 RepID=A0A409XM52_PSICY|nr:hypothetical protein CVT25_000435 [Psilocybe cyanescens]